MALNKNYKRTIGIIASYLLGLSSSSGIFVDHKVSYCSEHKKIFHPDNGESCCNKTNIENLNCKAYQQCDHFVKGLHFFQRGDKIFYCLVRDCDYNLIYDKSYFKDLEQELKQFDKFLFTIEELENWIKDAEKKQDPHSIKAKLFLEKLKECYDDAANNKGTINWTEVNNDNPLDFCAVHIPSAKAFEERLQKKNGIVNLIECFSSNATNKEINGWFINHGTPDILEKAAKFNPILSNEELKKRSIKSNTNNTFEEDKDTLRSTNFVFFCLNNQKRDTEQGRVLYKNTKSQFYIKNLKRIPLMFVSRDLIWDTIYGISRNRPLQVFFGDGLGVINYFINKNCRSVDDIAKLIENNAFDRALVEVRIPGPIYRGKWGNNFEDM